MGSHRGQRSPKARNQLTGKIANANKSQRYQQLKKRDGPACHYCGRVPDFYTIDHVIPRSRGGADRKPNMVLACSMCNNDKGDRLLSEWTHRWYDSS